MGNLGSSVVFLASSGGTGETKVLGFVASYLLFSPQLLHGDRLEGPRLPLGNSAACFQCPLLQLHMDSLFCFSSL